jgi:hypothetical protein
MGRGGGVGPPGEEGKTERGGMGQRIRKRSHGEREVWGFSLVKPFSLFFQNYFAIEFEFNSNKV